MSTCEQEIANLRALLQVRPHDAALYRQLGNAFLSGGQFNDAVLCYQRALQIEPGNVRGHNNLGQALMRLGQPAAAARSFERAIELDAGYAIAYNNLGNALRSQGLMEQAIDRYQRAIALQPGLAEAYFNCAVAFLTIRRASEALSILDRVLALHPSFVEALVCRGNALQQMRRFAAALQDYQHALELRPGDIEARNNAANALLEMGRPEEALSYCDEALRLRPDFAPAHNNRAGALRALQRHSEALAACDRALAVTPDYIGALCNRGKLLREMGEYQSAQESFRRALTLEADHPEARVGMLISLIPAIGSSEAEISASRDVFASELDGFSSWVEERGNVDETAIVGTSQPFFLAYQECSNRELLSRYGALCCKLMASWQARNAPPSALRLRELSRIRVGIVSAQLRDHPVYRALTKGWLGQLDRSRFEIGAFHLGVEEDSETQWARAHADFFVSGDRTLADWVEAIRGEGADVLIYPEIGMDPTTLRLASMRLATHQLAAWGHPETTGLPSIDHYLSAAMFEQPGSSEYYTEGLVPLPNLGCYYEPYGVSAEPCDLERLGIRGDCPILLCAGTPFKYAPRHDGVVVEIARRLGRCQLVFFEPKSFPLGGKLRDRLGTAFRAQGLDPSHYLTFLPWLSRPEFFALMRHADVYLDTLGFSGFNTAAQAVECELPLVTYEGRFMRGRLASAIMNRMALPEFVTRDPQEYIELAVGLAQDKSLRDATRPRLRSSAPLLFRDRASIDGLEQFLTQLVQQ